MKKLKNDMDYVEFYAKKLKENPKFFAQHKQIIDSQIKSSVSLFKCFGEGEEFKENVRRYLRGVGRLGKIIKNKKEVIENVA